MSMKYISIILFFACASMSALAKTPYDSFAPETSRSILKLEQTSSLDTFFCTIVADMPNQILMPLDYFHILETLQKLEKSGKT